MNVATVTEKRRGRPSFALILGVVGAALVAWAIVSIGVSTESTGSSGLTVRPLLPARFHTAAPTPSTLKAAFAAEGVTLQPAGADLEAARFGRLRPHIAAAFELAGRSQMLVVLFDRPEPIAASRVKTTAGDRDNGESAGRIYIEYRSSGLSSAAAARLRRAFSRLT
jgi:hypothetical protein